MPFLVLLFVANLMLVVLRDIKEDFLVKIIDMNGQSSWMFAQVDTVVTLIILALFGAMVFVKSNIKVFGCPAGIGRTWDSHHEFYIFQLWFSAIGCNHLAVCPKSLSVYCLPLFSKHFFRPLHRLFQDTGKRRFLYCLNRFSGVHGYDTGIGAKGIRGYEIGLGGIL